MSKKIEKWVMKKGMHLGFIKYSVSTGTIIEFHVDENKLVIDGQEFANTKDLAILKRHEWVEPYSPQAIEKLTSTASKQVSLRQEQEAGKKPKYKDMPVVQSDVDTHTTINISHTKKQKTAGVKQIEDDMEIIRYDETPEQRVARLKDDGEKKNAMPIVKDDTSLDGSGESTPALNKGGVRPRTAEEHAKLIEEGRKKAQKGFIDERIAKQMEVEKTPDGSKKQPVVKESIMPDLLEDSAPVVSTTVEENSDVEVTESDEFSEFSDSDSLAEKASKVIRKVSKKAVRARKVSNPTS